MVRRKRRDSMLSRFKKAILYVFNVKEYSQTYIIQGEGVKWTPTDYAKLIQAGYKACMTVYACVALIAKSGASIPWGLFRKPKSKKSKIEQVEDHEVLDRMKKPSETYSWPMFMEEAISYLELAGNSYVKKIGPKKKPPEELVTLQPDRVKVVAGKKMKQVIGYTHTEDGKDKPYGTDEILHMKLFNPLNDHYGMSPLEAAAKGIDISNMAEEWNANLLANDARPPGGLKIKGGLLEEGQRETLEKSLSDKLTGYKNVGRPPVLEGDMEWIPFSITPRDMDWLNSGKVNMRKICSVFNVAPELIGDSENKTYSNYGEARKALLMENVLPLVMKIRDYFNFWLLKFYGDDALYFDILKDQIEALQEDRKELYARLEKAWWLSINERRRESGKDDVAGGNIVVVPANLVPLITIGNNRLEE